MSESKPSEFTQKAFLSTSPSIPGSVATFIGLDIEPTGFINLEASLSVGDDRNVAYLDFSVFDRDPKDAILSNIAALHVLEAHVHEFVKEYVQAYGTIGASRESAETAQAD